MRKILLLSLLLYFPFLLWGQSTEQILAYQYYQQGEYEKATAILEKLFVTDKSDEVFDIYFNSLLKIKRYDEAEKSLKKLMRQDPANFKYPIELGRVYLERGNTEAGTKLFLQAINRLPSDEMKIREFANYFYRFEAYDMAIATFIRGREILNNDELFNFELLSIYRFKKDKNMLVQEYLKALEKMPQLLLQAQNALSNVFESDADYLVLQSLLLKKLQKNPEHEVFTQLLIWQYLQRKDYKMALRQLLAQDKRTKNDGALIYTTANTFIANEAYEIAIEAYEYLLAKGKENPYYLPAKIELIDAKYQLLINGKVDQASVAALAKEYYSIVEEYGKNSRTIFALRKWAFLNAYYLDQPETAEKGLEDALHTPGLQASEISQIKLELGDIYVITQQPWEAVLIYEQVAKQSENLPIGNEARFRSARLSYYQGNFEFAKSQADVLKASTSQLIANDALNLSLLITDNLQSSNDSSALKMFAEAEMLQFRKQNEKALSKLDSIAVAFPNNSLEDDILMVKSKIYTESKNLDKATTALKDILEKHYTSIWIDDAIFTLAGLYDYKLNDSEQAKELYQKLISDFPGSMYVAEARKRFRELRGDIIGS